MLGIVKGSLVVDNKDHIVSDGHMVRCHGLMSGIVQKMFHLPDVHKATWMHPLVVDNKDHIVSDGHMVRY